MKSSHSFSIRAGALSSEARREIRQLSNHMYEDHEDRSLLTGFPESDPRLKRMYEIISKERLVVEASKWGHPPPTCALRINRDYRPSDLIRHDYVEIKAWGEWIGARFEPDGPLELATEQHENCCGEEEFHRRNARISSVSGRAVVVRDKVRTLADRHKLDHVLYRPTLLTDWFLHPTHDYSSRNRITWESIGEEPWWELTSDLRLPRVSQAHLELVDKDGSPYVYGVSKRCIANEGFFAYPELHYRESEIRALEPFDCALTYEPFGGNPREENLTRVISRRFYELMIRNFIRVRAVPVRLDPD